MCQYEMLRTELMRFGRSYHTDSKYRKRGKQFLLKSGIFYSVVYRLSRNRLECILSVSPHIFLRDRNNNLPRCT